MYIENKSIFTSYYIMNIFHIIKYFSKHNGNAWRPLLWLYYDLLHAFDALNIF